MARKSCPQCKLVTGASTKTCTRCGPEFAAAAAPAIERRARRCAMCGIVNSATVTRCQCGFDFEQEPEDLRTFFKTRRANAWGLLVGSLLLGFGGTAILTALVLFSPVIPVKAMFFAFVAVIGGGLAGARKAMRILSATRINLDDLDGKGDAVPQARVVSK